MSKLKELIKEVQISDSYWARTVSEFDLHPLVVTLINDDLLPAAPTKVIYEWPHESETGDRTKLAYARDAKAHETSVYTRTSVGRYLRQNWPDLKDHEIRDLVVSHCTTSYDFKILTDLRDMICAALFGPESCMKWDVSEMDKNAYFEAKRWYEAKEDDGSKWVRAHPYCVYDPDLGWAVAVRLDKNGGIVGRAVVHMERKIFVRTYVLRSDPTAQSSDDNLLQAWLESQGLKKCPYWPEGVEFSLQNVNGHLFMPYLDGGCNEDRRIDIRDGRVVRDNDGYYIANCTDGSVTEVEPETWCDYCEEPIYNIDDAYCARKNGSEVTVCGSCADNHFVKAYCTVRHSVVDEILVHEDDIVVVYYDPNRFEWWDKYGLNDDIVTLDKPVEAEGRECWHAHINYIALTYDGRTIADICTVELDGKIYYVKDDVVGYDQETGKHYLIAEQTEAEVTP